MNSEARIRINDELLASLYEAHWQELYQYCHAYVKDKELSKELVQELFVNLWERRNKIMIRTSARQYLFSALKLKIFEHYRRQEVRERYLRQKSLEQQDGVNHTEEQVLYQELQQAFSTAVNSLPERSQLVYQLSREKGLSNKAISRTLSITEKAVEGNLTRAISLLKKKLQRFR